MAKGGTKWKNCIAQSSMGTYKGWGEEVERKHYLISDANGVYALFKGCFHIHQEARFNAIVWTQDAWLAQNVTSMNLDVLVSNYEVGCFVWIHMRANKICSLLLNLLLQFILPIAVSGCGGLKVREAIYKMGELVRYSSYSSSFIVPYALCWLILISSLTYLSIMFM